jgi:hypothetical protein
MVIFHFECQSYSKNIEKCPFFRSTSFIFPPKPLECKIFINIINIFFLINVALLMKRIQDSSINSKKIGFYITKNLCHHVEHILFDLWLKYESIWVNIIILVDYFSIKLHSGTTFLKHVIGHLRTRLNHQNHK